MFARNIRFVQEIVCTRTKCRAGQVLNRHTSDQEANRELQELHIDTIIQYTSTRFRYHERKFFKKSYD